jgi:hypothetical protein
MRPNVSSKTDDGCAQEAHAKAFFKGSGMSSQEEWTRRNNTTMVAFIEYADVSERLRFLADNIRKVSGFERSFVEVATYASREIGFVVRSCIITESEAPES